MPRLLALLGESIVADTRIRFDIGGSGVPVALLEGFVEERFRGRGLGTAMLKWAAALVRSAPRGASTLRIDLRDAPLDAVELFTANGFALAVAEDEMACEIHDAAAAPLRPHMSLQSWSEETAPEFFRVYSEAFRDRPGFPGWDETSWRSAFASGPGFRGDLSLLLRSGRVPVAYAVCDVADDATGRILQMGVSPTWRSRGVAGRLIGVVLGRLQDEGLSTAVLSVNANNPWARRVYERAGFRAVAQYQSYRKALD
ncbi:MAG: GNAT family N-acetyltransferase [Tepidiformaceae bacterium]